MFKEIAIALAWLVLTVLLAQIAYAAILYMIYLGEPLTMPFWLYCLVFICHGAIYEYAPKLFASLGRIVRMLRRPKLDVLEQCKERHLRK